MASQLCSAFMAGCVARTVAAHGLPPAVISLASVGVASAMSYGLSRYWVFAADRASKA
jgi:putative flippase GtrA